MITDAILNVLHGLAVTLAGWISSALPAAPAFVTTMTDALNTAVGVVPSAIRYFVPIGPLLVAGAAFIALVVLLGAIRLARRVLSLFTGGGGNA